MRELLAAALLLGAGTAGGEPDAARQDALRHLLLHDCGSCHGMTLRGGLGPALTAGALATRSPEMLRATVRYGRPGTPMPPWRGILSDEEIDWLVDGLKDGRFVGADRGDRR